MLMAIEDPWSLPGNELSIHFQPIVSLKQSTVVGLEALVRPGHTSVGQLFAKARQAGRLLELDRRCRARAMEEYRGLHLPRSLRPFLFLNIETSLIDERAEGSGALLAAVLAEGLDPSDIVIELNETQTSDTVTLKRFVERHREMGFLIALDDMGSGYSNLPRIAELRPHIIKLDRSLVASVDRSFFKQETVKSLVLLGKTIGCLVLAEGVETQAELDTCAALGAELFQGFHLARAKPTADLHLAALQPMLKEASRRQRSKAVAAIQARRKEGLDLLNLARTGCDVLRHRAPAVFDTVLAHWVSGNAMVEAAYALDGEGLQISHTHLGQGIRPAGSRLFMPAQQGTDHANKEYFFSLRDTGLKQYITDSYISLATGQPCRTVAVMVEHSSAVDYVLCIDQRLSPLI
ncbi:EAL domain-containing protein [Cyanobium sp. Morenito 9A2]|nr:EAL domain-containing protein [Cyanobium sp. Morenito 9A2]